MNLGMFYWNCGHHIAAWRHPSAVPNSGENMVHLIKLAQLAERGKFDMFFMADSISFWRGTLEEMSRDSHVAWVEPFTLMAALAQHTEMLGLACTATATYDQPFFLARRFASLDIASGGRGGGCAGRPLRPVLVCLSPALEVRSSPIKLQSLNHTTLAPPKKGRVCSAS